MKILFDAYSGPRATLITGEVNKVVEDQKGSVLIKVGVGVSDEVDRRKLISIVRKVIRLSHEHKLSSIGISLDDFNFKNANVSDYELGRIIGENFELANYEFRRYKTPPKEGFPFVETVHIDRATDEAKRGIKDGQIVGIEANYARELSNTPGGDMTPTILSDAVKKQLKGLPVKVTVLSISEIKKLKMGLILGVDRGSAEEAKFIIAEYWGAGRASKDAPIVLVGKGITFDTGGINLKPSDSLLGMNQDMSGGAAVIAALAASARLKVKKNVIALVPAVENAVSGSAYRPGDVLTAMNGKKVEIMNTDAEGRLILGDALTYAERYKPRLVIDVATLTGAALVVVGKRASVIMTRNQELEDSLRKLGEESGDYVWPLPLWKEYEADVKSSVADIMNAEAGSSKRAGGGCIQGGIFLTHFAKSFPKWAHIDIAPRMESIPEDNLAKGAAGAPVRLLVRTIEAL